LKKRNKKPPLTRVKQRGHEDFFFGQEWVFGGPTGSPLPPGESISAISACDFHFISLRDSWQLQQIKGISHPARNSPELLLSAATNDQQPETGSKTGGKRSIGMASSWVRAQDTRAKIERPGHRRTKNGVATCVDDTQMQTNKERRQGVSGRNKAEHIMPCTLSAMGDGDGWVGVASHKGGLRHMQKHEAATATSQNPLAIAIPIPTLATYLSL